MRNLEANISEGKNINLTWQTTNEERTAKYLIYRGTDPGFEVGERSFISETTVSNYQDKGLQPYKHYFYKVVPVHSSGEVFFESGTAHVETFVPGKMPVIKIAATNSNTVKKYEKFEINIDNGLYFGNKNSYTENQNIFITGITNNQTENIKWELTKI